MSKHDVVYILTYEDLDKKNQIVGVFKTYDGAESFMYNHANLVDKYNNKNYFHINSFYLSD